MSGEAQHIAGMIAIIGARVHFIWHPLRRENTPHFPPSNERVEQSSADNSHCVTTASSCPQHSSLLKLCWWGDRVPIIPFLVKTFIKHPQTFILSEQLIWLYLGDPLKLYNPRIRMFHLVQPKECWNMWRMSNYKWGCWAVGWPVGGPHDQWQVGTKQAVLLLHTQVQHKPIKQKIGVLRIDIFNKSQQ